MGLKHQAQEGPPKCLKNASQNKTGHIVKLCSDQMMAYLLCQTKILAHTHKQQPNSQEWVGDKING